MTLSDLTKYAEQYYGIRERHKQTGMPEVSELCHNKTGGRIALLMRQWDRETGEIIEACDLKCGKMDFDLSGYNFICKPFRMKGNDWVGIKFDSHTDKGVVQKLFRYAVNKEKEAGSFTLLLDAPISPSNNFKDTPLFSGDFVPDSSIPVKISQMQQLYSYGAATPEKRAENFYRQGKFMEDYQDDFFWSGDVNKMYYTTYHDLNVKQLRAYFTWRTKLRKGEFNSAPDAFVYIYLYELINGIGITSAENGLKKLQEMYDNVHSVVFNYRHIQSNITKWIPDFIIVNNLPVNELKKYYDNTLSTDNKLLILAHPENQSDSLLLETLFGFANREKMFKLPIEGFNLAADIWRYAIKNYTDNGGVMARCFGGLQRYIWQPFSNAIFYSENRQDFIYEVNEIRKFFLHNGSWYLQCYSHNYISDRELSGILHLTEARLRRYFKTGKYLKENTAQTWYLPYINAVLEEDKREKEEALRPKININLESLDNIRQNAAETRDSLLTEEELAETSEPQPVKEEKQNNDTDIETKILVMLLNGENPEKLIKENRLMPTIIADSINEKFYDEIGDNVIECEGSTLKIVEDYFEDLKACLS